MILWFVSSFGRSVYFCLWVFGYKMFLADKLVTYDFTLNVCCLDTFVLYKHFFCETASLLQKE